MREFRYLRDPLFLAAVAVFLINRQILEQIWSSGFVHNHVNDLICAPFLIPVMLTLMRSFGLRPHDDPPKTYEIAIALLVWGLFFEVLLPLHSFWGQWATADPYDLLCYWIGGVAAAIIWRSGSLQGMPQQRGPRVSTLPDDVTAACAETESAWQGIVSSPHRTDRRNAHSDRPKPTAWPS